MYSKSLLTLMIALIATVLTTGCSDDEVIAVYDPVPQPPQNVFTVTGDVSVSVFWTAPYEGDITFYGIYRSAQEFTGYDVIATISAEPNPDRDLVYYDPGYIDTDVTNGETYFYAVTSIDRAGHESELSAESAFDTPRPDGEMTLYDDAIDSDRSGFDFSTGTRVASENPEADVYLDRDLNNVFYINSTDANNVLVQAAGFHSSFDGVGWAPQDGWSYTGWAEIVPGHIYIVAIKYAPDQWNYAKLRVLTENDNAGTVRFQWAFQTDINNPELAPPSDANIDTRSRVDAGSTL
ncbi:MAG: hypothetical protein OEV49_13045 [candidate division Zixibacteria bacterium]|nr:hypothetical protein [candidate division Zixibacteria bacterium]MDH3938918.1 hypothetical protein [candidate division Zixibacteria bacterium]MDH4034110.1 hypothetical protein [candidate division Zixibacteria bacterium]